VKKFSSYDPYFFRYKMNSYKNIGICYQNLCNYSIALIYFGKMLRLAWYLKDIDSELKAYDFIGIQFFYSG